ncbi:SurA N-terminal domain-containing protein [Algiphilus aromaticivorans]|uniref:SurA N-terminal domain-containing protein n=1 Tax=Algiphilus aromaticivorans TaxID=382454 RepID=UPI0006950065|nr:SurA N-terminal domain-containing protein [Algiphilus aromaticivorans]
MLQSLRDRTSGLVAWFIVGLLIIPFAFFGIEQFATGNPDPEIATVGDEEITMREFRNAYNQRYQRLIRMLGEDFDVSQLDQGALREGVLESMIQEKARLQYAERQGWRTSDQAVVDFLKSVPAFQQDGRFSSERYRQLLAQQGMDPQRYERQLREGLRAEQLRNAVVSSAFVVPKEAERVGALRSQRRDFDYVRVPVSRYLGESEPEEAAVREAYEAERDRWQVPERVRLAYLEIDRENLASEQAMPEESVLRRIYEAEAESRFSEPERRRVRHILVEGEGARAKLEEAAQRIADGADFGEVAAELSDDPGSAEEGGSLGWVERGDMVPGFEEAAFALDEGAVSDPVESEFGWHLIQVDEIEESRTRGFEDEEVQERLLRIYREREADVVFREIYETVEQISFEQAASLEPAAEAAGLEVQTTEWLPRGSEEALLAHPEVAEAAFSESLRAGENSRPIELAPGRVVVIRQAEYQEARVRDFEEVREDVASRLRRERARERAIEVAERMLEGLREGVELSALAEEESLELRTAEDVTRGSGAWQGRILSAVFAMPRPAQADGVVARRVDPGDDGIGVLRLRAVHDGEAEGIDEGLARRLRGRVAGAEFAGVENHIAEAVTVERQHSADDLPEPEGAQR